MTPDDQSAEVLALHIRIRKLEAEMRQIDDVLVSVSGLKPKREPQAFVDACDKIEDICRAALDDRSAP